MAVKEIVKSRAELNQMMWDNPDATVEFTATKAYLALGDGVVFVALLERAS